MKREDLKVGMRFKQVKPLIVNDIFRGVRKYLIDYKNDYEIHSLTDNKRILLKKDSNKLCDELRVDINTLNNYFKLVEKTQDNQDEQTITKEENSGYKPTIEELNVGKEAFIHKNEFLKEGLKVKITAVVKDTRQYVVNYGLGNIGYVNFEDVEVVEPKKEWKDLKYTGYDRELGDYIIYVLKDKIKVSNVLDEMFKYKEHKCDLNLCQSDLEIIQKACKLDNDKAIEYILLETKKKINEDQLNSIAAKIIELEETRDKMSKENNQLVKFNNALFDELERLVK